MDFFKSELGHQQAWRDTTSGLGDADRASPRGARYVAKAFATIWHGARDDVKAYVVKHRLNAHRHFDHLLSSQAFLL